MDKLQRLDDWEKRFFLALALWQGRPFIWGTHDCAHFAADVVQALTDHDLSDQFDPLYSDHHSAQCLISQLGGVIKATSSVLGQPVDIMTARRGDIVAVRAPQGLALGVVTGIDAVALTEQGLRPFAVGFWRHCWAVG